MLWVRNMDDFLKCKDKVQKSLLKKALGYRYNEVIAEYSIDEKGDEVLVKKKVTTKDVPPDIQAVKLLLDSLNVEHSDFENLTDEELKTEIENAMKLIEINLTNKRSGDGT